MNSEISKKIISAVSVLAVFGVVFYGGFYMGKNNRPDIDKIVLINKETGKPEQVDFGPFWKSWNIVNEKYVSLNGIDDQKKVWGAIQGMTSSLGDPYTVFMPPTENEMFESDIKGNFEGVGMEIGIKDNILTVVAPLKNTPAEKAGILPKDKILEINGTTTVKMTTEEAVKNIRGKGGTTVTFTIVRDGVKEPIKISVTRDIINIPTIDTELKKPEPKNINVTIKEDGGVSQNVDIDLGNIGIDKGVFIIRLYSFSANSANLFRESLRKFMISGSDKLILDLRGNPGGFLESSVDMASWFLSMGKIVVRENFGKDKEEIIYRSRGYDIFNQNLKFVILVNGGSASASEILAGALKEHKIAKIVGEKTFGKGSVQELIPITKDTSLKVTVARWLTPNGNSISEKGLDPDVEVKMTLEDFKVGKDPQMEKAIELLSDWK